MMWKTRYSPPQAIFWQGRSDAPPLSCFFQIIKLCNLLQQMPICNESPTFALVGFCCDEGIKRNNGRIGASEAPFSIRAKLAKLALNKPNIQCYDVGDITCQDGNLEAAQQALAELITYLLQLNMTPIVFGGGHEVAWGHYQGIVNYSSAALGIVNFDAHFDMRPLLMNNTGSSGTAFLQMAQASKMNQRAFHYYCIGIQPATNVPLLFDTARQYEVNFVLAEEMYLAPEKCQNMIASALLQNEKIYLSICLDVFASFLAPGVSAPQVLGLMPWHVLLPVRNLAKSGKVLSYDIAELSPTHDIDQRTAKLAAHIAHEIITHHAS